MDEKTLEAKLVSVKSQLEDILSEGELCKCDYMHKVNELLKKENVVYGNGKAISPIAKHVSGKLVFGDKLSYYHGLKKDYVSLAKVTSLGEETKEDIDKYIKVYELTKMYMTNNFDTSKTTRVQFESEATGYLLSLPEMDELDEVRKEYIGKKIVRGIIETGRIRFSTRSEDDALYGKYNISDINKAFENINKGNGIK